MYVCVPSRKTRFPVDWRLLVKYCIANIGIPLDIYFFSDFFYVCNFFLLVSGSLQTSLLCIIGELAGGGSVAVVFGVIDK